MNSSQHPTPLSSTATDTAMVRRGTHNLTDAVQVAPAARHASQDSQLTKLPDSAAALAPCPLPHPSLMDVICLTVSDILSSLGVPFMRVVHLQRSATVIRFYRLLTPDTCDI